MRSLLCCLAIFCVSHPCIAADPDSLKPFLIAASVAAVADIARTQYDIRHGATEQNPMIPSNPIGNAVALASSYAVSFTIAHALKIHGHTRAARLFTVGIAADASACVAHNFRLFRW